MCAIMGFSTKKLDKHEIWEYFDRTLSRGPDMSRIMDTGSGWLCFHRLAIMGLTEAGMQPFELDGDMVVCNGELYGFRPLKRQLTEKGYEFKSGSDCEIILPLYREYGLSMFAKLDAEFAMIIYDHKTDSLIAARDPIGIRPLFYGYLDDGGIVFASEAKNLIGLCKEVCSFPPGHYYAGGKFIRIDHTHPSDSDGTAERFQIHLGGGIALDVVSRRRVLLMTRHAGDAVIENDNGGI